MEKEEGKTFGKRILKSINLSADLSCNFISVQTARLAVIFSFGLGCQNWIEKYLFIPLLPNSLKQNVFFFHECITLLDIKHKNAGVQ